MAHCQPRFAQSKVFFRKRGGLPVADAVVEEFEVALPEVADYLVDGLVSWVGWLERGGWGRSYLAAGETAHGDDHDGGRFWEPWNGVESFEACDGFQVYGRRVVWKGSER